MDKITQELVQNRAEIIDSMRGILNKAETENRDLTTEENERYQSMEADADSIQNRVKRIESQGKLDSSLDTARENSARIIVDSDVGSKFGKEYGKAFYSAMRTGTSAADATVMNALQVGTNSEGGYIVPEEFETMLAAAQQDINEVRQYANVISTGSDRHIPVESSLGSATWTAEEAAYTESDAAFGRVTLEAHKLGTIIKVSEELLQDSFFGVDSYLATNFGKRFGLAEESAFIAGDNSGKPNGIVQGSSLGVTAAGTAAITSDELIDLYHSLARPYRSNAAFLMNDSTAKLVRKLKDGNSQYLWQPGLQAGQPDTLLGRPVIVSTAMPAATTGLKSMVFGDLSYYTIADRTGTVMQRLNELYAANGQVGFRAYKRTDGETTLSAAIKHLIQA